jgi:hypothetical protein
MTAGLKINAEPTTQVSQAPKNTGVVNSTTTNTSQNTNQPKTVVKNTTKPYPKTLEAMKLVDMGLPAKQALQYVNLKDNISNQAVSKFKAKYKKYSLASPKMVKLANVAIKDCLSDKPINGDIFPSYTNKLAAVSLVYDRYEPAIKQQANLNINVDCHPVDLARWANVEQRQGNQVIDVTPPVINND